MANLNTIEFPLWGTYTNGIGWIDVTTFGDKERQYIPGIGGGVYHKRKCDYCGSQCDDIRGNCGACGAPK